MTLEKKFLTITLIAIVLAVPLAFAMKHRTNQIHLEKSQNNNLRFQIDSKEKQLEEQNLKLQEEQKKNEELNKQLQSKREAEAKLATAQAVKPPVRISGAGNCATYSNLVAQYDWDARIALAIMQAESGCNPNASSPTNDHGLMQINQGLAILGSAIYDPATNIKYAYEHKYLKGGWRHWTVFNTGAYLRYM